MKPNTYDAACFMVVLIVAPIALIVLVVLYIAIGTACKVMDAVSDH